MDRRQRPWGRAVARDRQHRRRWA